MRNTWLITLETQHNKVAQKEKGALKKIKLLCGQSNLIYSNLFTWKVNYPNVLNSACT